VTSGEVGFVYGHIKLDEFSGVTPEYTITTSYLHAFSGSSDSGGPVINTDGQVVGLVLGETTGSPVKLIGHEDLVSCGCVGKLHHVNDPHSGEYQEVVGTEHVSRHH